MTACLGVRSIGRLPEERIERFVGSVIDRLSVALKEPRTGGAAQRDGVASNFQPGALAKAENGYGVFFVEFTYAFFSGFVRRGRVGIGIDKVWINLKWNEAQRVEACRKHDWHVVRRFDRGAGQICSSAYSKIWRAGTDTIAESMKDAELVECIEKAERVSAAHEKCFGVFDCGTRVWRSVKRVDEKP